jgi:hypothetical protein
MNVFYFVCYFYLMKLLKRIILPFLLLVGFFITNQVFSQNRKVDSLYKVYLTTTNINLKLDKTPGLVTILVNAGEIEKANKVIIELEKLHVAPLKT